MSLELHISEDAPACAQLDLKQACLSASEPTGACADDSFIPWNRLFLCGGQHLDLLAYVAFIIGLVLCTSVVMWIGVNLLSKNAEMYFAPALEDLCIKWDVPKRTAAALFVALANGAPDLAATGYMFKQGQGDMAFGALLGAGAYVCMNVIGMIILLKPKVATQATPALLRDILSFLGILLFFFPIFLSGLTRKWVLILNGTYALLTVAIFCGDEWHKRGRPSIFASLFSRTRSGAFEPLVPSDSPESGSSAHSNFELLEQWEQPSSPPPLPANFSSYVQEASSRMHHMRASRLRSNRIALNDGDPSASPPALQIPALALDTLPESPRDASLQSNGPSPSSSPSFQPPLHRVPPTILMPHPVSRNTDGTVLHAYESFGHAQVNGPGGASGAIGESAQRDAQNVQRTNSSSTVASGGHTDSPTAIVVSPPGEEMPPSATSGGASTSTSRMIFPGDSISQQRGPAPERAYRSGIAMDTFEVEVSLPHAPAASWALNDSLRVLGMLFPPCSDSPSTTNLPPAPDDLLDPFQLLPDIHHIPDHGRYPGGLPLVTAMSGGSQSYPNSYSPAETGNVHGRIGTHMHGYEDHEYDEREEGTFACVSGGPCMPAMQWFSHALDLPDYVTYCSCPAQLRHPAHGVGLLLMLVPMALMRVTIPTVSGDFYDAFIFIVASTLAPFAAAPLFGMPAPLWLQVVFAMVSCAGALSFVASGGFGLPQWIQGNGVVPRLCMLGMSAGTLFMAVGWIQIIAGELVGCLQALGNIIQCPPSLLGFTLAAVNSLGDQATNLSVARSAGKRAAIAACFSSMTFNMCIASAYGWALYTRKEGGTVVPLKVSAPTWLLLCALTAYLLGLLAVIFWGWRKSGGTYIPYGVGRSAQMVFFGLMVLFVCQGVFDWIRG